MTSHIRSRATRPLAFLFLSAPALGFAQTAAAPLKYPAAALGNQIDDYHGKKVADPYRWLEDADSPQTKAWVEAENALTFGYLSTIPERDAIRRRLTEVWNYPKYAAPFKEGNRYFYFENSGLQNQSVLYVREGDKPARALLDPNVLSADGTVALSASEVSPNGKYLAYSVAVAGSDWVEFRVRDVETGRDLKDTLKWSKFSDAAWTRDNRGFFYSRYDEPKSGNVMTNVNRNQKVYYHHLNTPQSADELIFDRPDRPDWLFDTHVTDDGTFAIITVSQGTDERNRLYYIFLDNPKKPVINAPVVRLIDTFDAKYEFVHNIGDNFLIRTDLAAPRGRVVSIDINFAQPRRWVTVIPEGRDALESVKPIGKMLVASYLQDAHSSVRLFGLPDPNYRGRSNIGRPSGGRTTTPTPLPAGTPIDARLGGAIGYPFRGEIQLPTMGSVDQISGKPGNNEMFYTFVSYLNPRTVFRYDLGRNENTVYKQPKLPFDASVYETKQVFYNSKDGTRIPMFITARKGVQLNGSNPTILYGYGGFNIPETPSFSPRNLVWLELGGIYAVANIRGGSEYGKEWHEGGMLAKKQNVFDDFIAAAEYLIREKYTSTPKLAVTGGSNGGLLVGAVLNQRPDLFGAAIPATGVMDMLRFQKFTIGWAWTSDYGSSDDPKQFEVLRAYSPVHNIKPGTRYPPTMGLTADHDDRVVPGHSFKYAAALQAAQVGPAPILIRIETRAGHGAGKPTSKLIEESADRLAFLVRNLHVAVPARQ
jgi:prolyl oligopeptidase